ncbi:MAG: DNA-binding protein [Thermoplasmata archaeon]|nr:DNA-binding protein [Thermoplasmata archaeon]
MDVESLYSLVSDLLSFERFKYEIEKRKEKYGGLLDDDAIAYMIVDELGRNPGNKMKIGDLYDGINVTVEATVEKVGAVETRKNGKLRIMRVDIADETGKCQLVLWNEEIDEIGGNLREGMKIKIINGYVKENIYGLQISLGRWGIIIFE